MMEMLNEILANFFLFVFYLMIALCAIGGVIFLLIILILPFFLGLFFYFVFTGQGLWALLALLGCVIFEPLVGWFTGSSSAYSNMWVEQEKRSYR
jgi:hypothetical protein